jgi:polyhydroxyalkanoate synthase subunit PhaC
MGNPSKAGVTSIAPADAAPQQRPRPLTLFLELVRRETAGDPERLARVLKGVRAYQEAPREPTPKPLPALAERSGATLRDYGGAGAPVLFVPSLINPPNILDLGPDRSLLRWLAGQGHRVLLLDWGAEIGARRDLTVSDHIDEILLPLARELGPDLILVGYCLGGTMALAAASALRARAVATIAAPWHFDGFPDPARADLTNLWSRSEPAVRALGLLPMEVLQSGFWSLDPARTVAKFEAFAAMAADSAEARAFVRLEDWANDGPPLPEAAARELFEGFFAADRPGRDAWRPLPAGPQLHILSTSDRIVPAATAPRTGDRIELDQGHVGMVIGSRARNVLWAPLDRWLSERRAR